jgi:Domain of unknown function (DUF1844)
MNNAENHSEPGGLHVDSDFKAQAEKEKEELSRKLGEVPSEAQKTGPAPSTASGGEDKKRLSPASFEFLVEQYVTQIMVALDAITLPGGKRSVDLDLAKFYIDLLGVVEEKTKNNLTSEEQNLISGALYDMRMAFVTVTKHSNAKS